MAPVLQQHETQVRRLDEADRQAGFGGITEFATQPELGFCLNQFAEQMLVRPSNAATVIDLQAELNRLELSNEQEVNRAYKPSTATQDATLASGLTFETFFQM